MSAPANANAGCVGPESAQAGKVAGCAGCPNQASCASGEARTPDATAATTTQRLSAIENKILVLSGKGGVGKSTISAQLAFALAGRGYQVGLLDADLTGPSIPLMLGLQGQSVHQSASGWSPVYVDDNLGVMSIGFLLPNSDDPVIWRGPKKTALLRQLLADVDWQQLNYLLIDTPPGTSDEHISVRQALQNNITGAIIVSTPQEASMQDVRKMINFCRKTNIPVLGVVENMCGYSAPLSAVQITDATTGTDVTAQLQTVLQEHAPELLQANALFDVFPAAGGGPAAMADAFGVPFLGRLPLDSAMLEATENGESFLANNEGTAGAAAFNAIVDGLVSATCAAPEPPVPGTDASAAPATE